MNKTSHYYYIESLPISTNSDDRNHELVKWNEAYYVQLNENTEDRPGVSVIVNKFKNHGIKKPKSYEIEKVKPILQELFIDYYNNTLQNLVRILKENGEYYIIKKSKKWHQIEFYTGNKYNNKWLSIVFRDSVKDLWLSIYSDEGMKGREMARRHGIPITYQEMNQFLNLTLKYLSDPESYLNYINNYLKGFYKLVSGETQIEGFDISSEKAFKSIIIQLKKRKTHLEKRLIEEDDISKEDRIKLRGELEGINYSLKTINLYK